MPRSSTSSSELPAEDREPSLAISDWRCPGLLLGLALLLVVEFGVARQDWIWTRQPLSPTGIIEAIEHQVIAPAPAPLVLAMGSSRVRDAIAPRPLERHLGLPAGTVLNLAISAGTSFDALTLYRRNRDRLSQAKVLVFGVEDWHYNAGYGVNARDRRFATLAERLAFDPPSRLTLLAGWVWRTSDAQIPLRFFVQQLGAVGPSEMVAEEDGRMIDHAFFPERLEEPAIKQDVELFYRDYRLGLARHRQLQELIDLATADGVRVLVIQVPLLDTYVDLAEQLQPEAYRAYHATVKELTGAQQRIYERGTELGLTSADYLDYGHVNQSGSHQFTADLAPIIARLAPDLNGRRVARASR